MRRDHKATTAALLEANRRIEELTMFKARSLRLVDFGSYPYLLKLSLMVFCKEAAAWSTS